jgi:hypothetical protein
MSRDRRRGRRARQIVAAVAILAALAGSFFLSGPMASVLHRVTGGKRTADVVAGVMLLIVPMAAIIGYAYLAQRRGWAASWGWWLLVLYLPAFALEPFGRSGTNIALQRRVDSATRPASRDAGRDAGSYCPVRGAWTGREPAPATAPDGPRLSRRGYRQRFKSAFGHGPGT